MVTVNNINGNPESTPEVYFGSKSDGQFFYFYETKEEFEASLILTEAQQLAVNISIFKNNVQVKTEALLVSGFTYNGKTFFLDKESSVKWLGLKEAQISEFPINIVSKEGQVQQLTALTVIDFYNAAFSRGRAIEEGGGVLKYQASLCTTQAQLDAIVDNRV